MFYVWRIGARPGIEVAPDRRISMKSGTPERFEDLSEHLLSRFGPSR
jgi:hypothetical protein